MCHDCDLPNDDFQIDEPGCGNCGNSTDIGGCKLTDGCRHLYKPEALESITWPVTFHRDVEAVEYDRFVNCHDTSIERINGKLTLSSNMIHEIFTTDSDRAIVYAETVLKEIDDDRQEKKSHYQRHPPQD